MVRQASCVTEPCIGTYNALCPFGPTGDRWRGDLVLHLRTRRMRRTVERLRNALHVRRRRTARTRTGHPTQRRTCGTQNTLRPDRDSRPIQLT